MGKFWFNAVMTAIWGFITTLNVMNALVYYTSHDNSLGLYPFLLTCNILLVLIYGLQAFVALLQTLKTKIYVYENGIYRRVVGPKGLTDSLGGLFGHITVGATIEIETGMFAPDTSNITNVSINGYNIRDMDLRPIDRSDERELGINQEKEP